MKHLKLFLIIWFLIISTAMPAVVFDPDMEYNVIHQYHRWLTPYVYQLIYINAKDTQLTTSYICGLIKEESNGSITVVSYAGAVGLMQVMPCHLRLNKMQGYSLDDEAVNLYLGSRYYRWCLNYAQGNQREAQRYYNAGPASVRKNYKNWKYVDAILAHSNVTAKMLIQHKVVVR